MLHYIGAGVAFPTSMLFLLLQSVLTYRVAKTRGQCWTGHLRSILTALAFVTLVFSILWQGAGGRCGTGWQAVVLPGGHAACAPVPWTGRGAEARQLAVGVG